jgi:hypothetical protein
MMQPSRNNGNMLAIRYQLWNGKSQAVLERIGKIYCATQQLVGVGSNDDTERIRRFRQHLIELCDYLRSNSSSWIPLSASGTPASGINKRYHYQ